MSCQTGSYHRVMPQMERDALKDGILKKGGITLLRLRTIESDVENKIEKFLARWADL